MNPINKPAAGASLERALRPTPSRRAAAPLELLDNLARSLGSGLSRRRAFQVALKGVAAAALAEFGVKSTWAADTCLCRGQTYDPLTACCTPAGVQQKHPMSSLAGCPNRVPHAGHTPVPNGCGAEGGTQFPGGFGAASFTPCCNAHDICYGTCNDGKAGCDSSFLNCMLAACDAAYPPPGAVNAIKRSSCRGAANTYFSAVDNFGGGPYEAAQSAACDCCSETSCPEECAGSYCETLPHCGNDPDCYCFNTTEGRGFCSRSVYCSGLATCSSSAQCPSGFACSAVTCCGNYGVCIPACDPIRPNDNRAAAAAAKPSNRKTTSGR